MKTIKKLKEGTPAFEQAFAYAFSASVTHMKRYAAVEAIRDRLNAQLQRGLTSLSQEDFAAVARALRQTEHARSDPARPAVHHVHLDRDRGQLAAELSHRRSRAAV